MSEPRDEADPFDIDAQAKQQADRDERERLRKLIDIGDLKWLMSFKQGRRIMWGMLAKYGIYRTSFSDNPLQMAFLEGQRNCGLELMRDLLEHTPERYAEMLKDEKDGRRRDTSSTGSAA